MTPLLIARRDLAAHLHGYAGYAIIASILLIDGMLFNFFAMGGAAKYSHEVLEDFFYFSSGTTMVAAVLLSMPSIAEERGRGTDVLLQTSAVSDASVVFGKYLATVGILGLLTALTAYMPALIFVNGKVSASHVLVGYLGLMLLGSTVASMGIFASSLFRNQLPAGVIGGVLTVVMLLGWLGSQVTDPPFTDVLAYTALFDQHFQPFQEGRLPLSSVVFYATVSFLFLMLATRVLQGRRHE
jgi:ABC-2 type transport system permease protein